MSFKEIDIKTLDMNPFTLLGDEWTLITAGTKEKCNTMTASWGGLGVIWNKNVVTVYVRPGRYTKEFIDQNGTFSLSFFDKQYKKALGICGSVSGRDEDKIAKSGLSVSFDKETPYIEEAKLVFVCKKLYHDVLKPEEFEDPAIDDNYKEKDYHTLYIGEILKVLTKE